VVVSRVGGPSPWALLLVFAGPMGWLVILGLWLGMRGEDVSVRVPFHHDAWHAIQRVTIVGRMLIGVGVVGILAVLLTHPSRLGGTLAAAALLVGFFTVIAARLLLPRVRLDATRRWVTLSGVHPAFRDAVLAEPTTRVLSDQAGA
jgi:hypothetical protein